MREPRGRRRRRRGGPAGRAGAAAQLRAAPAWLPRAKPARSRNAQADVQELLAVHILFLIIIIIIIVL